MFAPYCRYAVDLPEVNDSMDEWFCNRCINEALLEMDHHGRGPIQINFLEPSSIGVGTKPRPDYDLADWVLGKFPPDDAKLVTGRHTDVEAACRLLMAGKLGEAQNKFNH